jgi:hypothetical protein
VLSPVLDDVVSPVRGRWDGSVLVSCCVQDGVAGMERMPYATDLTDEQWALPLVTVWKQERVARSATGVPGSCDLRSS